MAGSGKRPKTPRDTEALPGEPAPVQLEGNSSRGPGLRIRALTGAECEDLLDRHRVGRIAYAHGRHVDILPIHYIRDGAWLYGRTSPGAKVDAWQHSKWIAFEVDEVHDILRWSSVVVHGGLYMVPADGPEHDEALRSHAIGLLRRIISGTGTPGDPVPERTVIFRIHLDEVQGRTAEPGG